MSKVKDALRKNVEQNKILTDKMMDSMFEKNEEISNLKRKADLVVEEFKRFLNRQKNVMVKELEDQYLEKHAREVTLLRQHIFKI